MSIFHYRKAAKVIDNLYILRKEKYPEYQVLLAPFYYKVGDALCTYIEINTDEMNQLKPLVLPDEPDDMENVAEEEDEAQSKDNNEEEKKEDDPEPKIEDVIDSSSKPAPVVAAPA